MSAIFNRDENFAKWYTSILKESDLIEYGMVKGTIIFKPFAWSIWNNIQKGIDKSFKKVGTENCYFPTMIPFSEFQKEKEHIEGFSPEFFKIDYIGDKKLDDPLIIRPTSEIAFCNYFASLSINYNDLPIVLNQWCNTFRVEKNTKPFFRTSEFLWQEQHAIFESEKEAKDFSFRIINIYKEFMQKYLCIPVLIGKKTEYEKFAGADITYTIEAFMQDGQALQSGTSHYLGQNFATKFNMKYQKKDNSYDYVYQTSAGVSTRLIGAMIMSHSDDKGLILPSMVAPWKFAIVTPNEVTKEINELLTLVKSTMGSIIFKLDDSNKQIGHKLSEYEIKGIPFQIIIGKKEVETNTITIFKRFNGEKYSIGVDMLNFNYFKNLLDMHDYNLWRKASNFLNDSIVNVNNLEEFILAIQNKKIARVYWSGNEDEEKKLKDLTGASSRCISLDDCSEELKGKKCFYTGKDNPKVVYFARAY